MIVHISGLPTPFTMHVPNYYTHPKDLTVQIDGTEEDFFPVRDVGATKECIRKS